DAALTYIDVEPIPRVVTIPLYRERYRLLVTKDSSFGQRQEVTWETVAQLPLCLLTPDTENRRIIESLLRGTGTEPRITLESDAVSVLFAHVRSGAWVSVVPEKLAQALHLTVDFNCIPIVEPEVVHTIGLVMPPRNPTTPLAAALAAEARRA